MEEGKCISPSILMQKSIVLKNGECFLHEKHVTHLAILSKAAIYLRKSWFVFDGCNLHGDEKQTREIWSNFT